MKGLVPLKYISLSRLKINDGPFGQVIDLCPADLDRLVAQAVVRRGVPLRGAEVKFLRKVIGMTMARLAGELEVTVGAIQKWERQPEQRLRRVNEVAVRALFAEFLKVKISGRFSKLRGEQNVRNLSIQFP